MRRQVVASLRKLFRRPPSSSTSLQGSWFPAITINMNQDGDTGVNTSFQRMADRPRMPRRDGSSRSRMEEFQDEYQRGSSRSSLVVNDGKKTNKYGDEEIMNEEDDEIYIVRQEYGYLSIFFSVVQTIILGLMMWQCGIAPMNINPMIGPYPDALSGM